MFYEIDLTIKAFNSATLLENDVTEYRVKGKPHLRLRVNKTKKSLMVRVCNKQRRKSKVLGQYPMMKLATFERLANEFCELVMTGEYNSLARRTTLNTFFIKVYLPLAKKNKKSWKDDESRYRLYVQAVIGSLMLCDIKSFHIQTLLNELPERLADATHDLIRALISVVFSTAIKYELLDKNPCSVVPARGNTKVSTRIMTEAEYIGFIQSCLIETDTASTTFSFHCLALLLALFTGMRIGNCISITRSMLSHDGNYLYLPDTKQNKPQSIHLSKQGKWVIQTALSMSCNSYIFPSMVNQGEHISRPVSTFKRVCRRAGINISEINNDLDTLSDGESLKIHSLRKSFCSTVLANTADIRLASFLLGHSDIAVTQKHYAFYQDQRLTDVVNQASDTMTVGIPQFPRLVSL
jgi:integrase